MLSLALWIAQAPGGNSAVAQKTVGVESKAELSALQRRLHMVETLVHHLLRKNKLVTPTLVQWIAWVLGEAGLGVLRCAEEVRNLKYSVSAPLQHTAEKRARLLRCHKIAIPMPVRFTATVTGAIGASVRQSVVVVRRPGFGLHRQQLQMVATSVLRRLRHAHATSSLAQWIVFPHGADGTHARKIVVAAHSSGR